MGHRMTVCSMAQTESVEAAMVVRFVKWGQRPASDCEQEAAIHSRDVEGALFLWLFQL